MYQILIELQRVVDLTKQSIFISFSKDHWTAWMLNCIPPGLCKEIVKESWPLVDGCTTPYNHDTREIRFKISRDGVHATKLIAE